MVGNLCVSKSDDGMFCASKFGGGNAMQMNSDGKKSGGSDVGSSKKEKLKLTGVSLWKTMDDGLRWRWALPDGYLADGRQRCSMADLPKQGIKHRRCHRRAVVEGRI